MGGGTDRETNGQMGGWTWAGRGGLGDGISRGQMEEGWVGDRRWEVGRMQQKTPGLRVKRPGFKFSLAAY